MWGKTTPPRLPGFRGKDQGHLVTPGAGLKPSPKPPRSYFVPKEMVFVHLGLIAQPSVDSQLNILLAQFPLKLALLIINTPQSPSSLCFKSVILLNLVLPPKALSLHTQPASALSELNQTCPGESPAGNPSGSAGKGSGCDLWLSVIPAGMPRKTEVTREQHRKDKFDIINQNS